MIETGPVEGLVVRSSGEQQFVLASGRVVRCRMRGRQRQFGRIYTGDRVEVAFLPDGSGVIEQVYPRRNVLIRPPVANVDLAVIVMSLREPDWQPHGVDRLCALAEAAGLEVAICIAKSDLDPGEQAERWEKLYRGVGYETIVTSAATGQGSDRLRSLLADRTSVLCGVSGAGKSSLLNASWPGLTLQTGEVSARGTGRHTTRRAELLLPEQGTAVVDTPGFSSIQPVEVPESELDSLFPEFRPLLGQCKYRDCRHGQEPDCAVKSAVLTGSIDRGRYDSYLLLREEIRSREATKY